MPRRPDALGETPIATPALAKIPVPDEGIETLFGARDENLKQLERQFDVQIRTDGHELLVSGEPDAVGQTERVLDQLAGLLREGYRFSREDVRRARSADEDRTDGDAPA